MASTVSNGNDRSEKWQLPFSKGKFASPFFWSSPVAFRNRSKRLIQRDHSSGLKLTFSGDGT